MFFMKLFIFTFIFIFHHSVLAQHENNIHYITYGTDEGLPSPEVYCAFEDSQGFMWIGTDNGVSKFDGYKFKNFGPKDGLMQNVIFNIHEDKLGRIWFGSMTGEAFIMENDSIYPYKYNHLVLEYKDYYTHTHLEHVDENLSAYFNLRDFGSLIIDNKGDRQRIGTNGIQSNIIYGKDFIYFNRTKSRVTEKDDQIKIDKSKIPSYIKINPYKNEIETFNSFSSSTKPVVKLKDKIILIGHEQIYHFTNDSLHNIQEYKSTPISEIIKLEENYILVAYTNRNGLYVYEIKENELKEKSNYFHNTSLNGIFIDRSKNIWICTKNYGLFLIPDFSITSNNPDIILFNRIVKSITIKNEKEIFILDGDKNIQNINGKNIVELKSDPRNEDLNILYDKSSDILWTPNAFIKDLVITKFRNFNDGMFIGKKIIQSIERDFLYISTKNKIFRLNKSNFNLKKINIKSPKDFRCYSIIETRNKNLLVGLSSGVYCLKNDTLSKYIHNTLLNIRIEDMEETQDSTLILATKGNGVILYKDSVQFIFNTDNGLASNMIEDIHTTNGDTIWVGTLNGLSRIIINSNPQVRTYTIANGLPSNEIYQIDTYNSIPYLATGKGLVKFTPPPIDSLSYKPVITDVSINRAIKKKYFDLKLPATKNELEIKYVTLNYKQLGNITYRYKLNTNSDWSYTKNTSALFTNLSSGNYKFIIQSENQDGYWSNITEVPFFVNYPWYNTWLAWFIYLLLSIIAIILVLWLQAKNIRKKANIANQIKELEKSALKAQINPHFMYNCLNAIERLIANNYNSQAIAYMTNFAELVRQSLDGSLNTENHIGEEIKYINNYLSLEQLRFKDQFKYEINGASEVGRNNIFIPNMIIQPFIENAIIHGVSHNPKDGLIKINFNIVLDKLIVEVIDNGPGFYQTTKNKADGNSVGIQITTKRLELLTEYKQTDKIKIIEIKDSNGNIKGTKVTIYFELKEKIN